MKHFKQLPKILFFLGKNTFHQQGLTQTVLYCSHSSEMTQPLAATFVTSLVAAEQAEADSPGSSAALLTVDPREPSRSAHCKRHVSKPPICTGPSHAELEKHTTSLTKASHFSAQHTNAENRKNNFIQNVFIKEQSRQNRTFCTISQIIQRSV